MFTRRKTREIFLGDVAIGGDNPIRVQSMCNTDTRDEEKTLAQILALHTAGCELVRVAVPDEKAVASLKNLCKKSPVPLIADIHFDYRLALSSMQAGVKGLRINPGNIGGNDKVDMLVDMAKDLNVAIRIGVNSGSVEKEIAEKFGGTGAEALVQSALKHVAMLEKRNFYNTKISLKSSSVLTSIKAYEEIAGRVDYPLHIGITEAGTLLRGAVKSATGLGILLYQGIGDTLRVSLTHDPVEEPKVAWEILRSLGLRCRGIELISCPTCGRTEIPLINLARCVEEKLQYVTENISVAVMGCVVNGPGEAKEADIGIAGGKNCGVIFRKGNVIKKIRGEENLLPEFLAEIELLLKEKRGL